MKGTYERDLVMNMNEYSDTNMEMEMVTDMNMNMNMNSDTNMEMEMEMDMNNKNQNLPNESLSYWLATAHKEKYPQLVEDIKTDVAIIGAGITGMTLSMLLSEKSVENVVIEARETGYGATGHTTAKITVQHSLKYDNLISKFGKEIAHQYADANQKALEKIAQLIEVNKIECRFRRQPAFIYTNEDNMVGKIENEAAAAASLFIKSKYLDSAPLPFGTKAALVFDNQAEFHPLEYIYKLAEIISAKGVRIFENSRVVRLDEENNDSNDNNEYHGLYLENGIKVNAKYIVMATHYPVFDKHGIYYTRLYPYVSYIITAITGTEFNNGMYISAEEPVRSLRKLPLKDGEPYGLLVEDKIMHPNNSNIIQKNEKSIENREIILIAGENHKTGHHGNSLQHYKNLAHFAGNVFKEPSITHRWIAQDYSTPDNLPYVGQVNKNYPWLLFASGFHKWGMTNGTAAAMILCDTITGISSPWQDAYNPLRVKPFSSIINLAAENAGTAVSLVFGKLNSKMSCKDMNNPEEFKDTDNPQEYKDMVNSEEFKDMDNIDDCRDIDNFEECIESDIDKTCTHMGCETVYNNSEKTWDCPCHGSRYNKDGTVIEGPAVKPLKKIQRSDNTVQDTIKTAL